jgi:tetratricopeptide (TPR) repeat protein
VRLSGEAFDEGRRLAEQGRWRDAADAFENVLRQEPDSYAAHFNLAYAYAHSGDLRNAATHFRRAAGLRPDEADTHYSLATVGLLAGDLDSAVESLDRAVERRATLSEYAAGQLAWLHYVLAWSLFARARQSEVEGAIDYLLLAERAVTRAMGLRSRDFEPLYLLGAVYSEIAKRSPAEGEGKAYLRRAVEAFDEALARDPASAPAHNDRGGAYALLGEDARAEADYLAAVNRDSRSVAALHNLGNLYLMQERWREALDICERALRIDAGDVEALNGRGVALLSLGRSDEAESDLRKAVGLNPGYANAHVNLGVVHHRRGERAQALACFQRAVEVAPGNEEANHNFRVEVQEQLRQRLAEAGLLTEDRSAPLDLAPYRDRTPIAVRGRPISETILEDRR